MSGSRCPAALLIAWTIAGGVSTTAADEVAAPPTPIAPPAFRRVFLPAEAIEHRAWTSGYIPVDAHEFERLLETVQSGAGGARGAGAAQIEKAEYALRLEGDDLLTANATLHLAPGTGKAAMLLLDPCALAIHAAAWQDQTSKPAVLGTGPDGRLRVAVEGSRLGCRGSLRGERTASGAVGFRLELPASPIARLTIDAAAGLDVTADQGVVSKTAGAPTNHWTIDLGGHNRVNLRLIREEGVRERRPLTMLRQSLEYEFSARGINVVAQLKVDVHGEPLQRVAVDLDPSLRLVSARYGEQQVPWSATADVESHVSHVILQMPDPIVGTGRVLQLSAMAPLTTNRHWRLPGLQPEGMSWQEGTATLLIPNSFVLEQLRTEGCRQSRITELPAPLLGESIEVQYYRPGASIEVLLAERREPLKVDSGNLVEVGAASITSRSAVHLSIAHGEHHAPEIDVHPGWTIDAVEDLQTGRAIDWEPNDAPSDSDGLKIRLRTSVTSDDPARLLLRGHRALPNGAQFEAGRLEMLDFSHFESGTRLICVRAAEGLELRWTDVDELHPRDAVALSPAEARLFPIEPDAILFVEDKFFSQSTVALERQRPSYAADIRIDASVQRQTLTETYTILCIPEAARIERLLVRFSQARDAPLEWSLAGGNSGLFSARKLTAAEQTRTGLSAGGEAWEVNLHLARPGAFELRSIRSVAIEGETPLALASLADAASQRGTLAIRAIGESGLSIKNRRLTCVPAELLEADRYQTARGAYHYRPSRDDLGTDAAVTITPAQSTQAESGAWAWSNRLDSRYAADGTCVHWATFRVQTAGRQQIRVTLPEDARLLSAWVDRQRLVSALPSSSQESLVVDLPSGRGFAAVSLYYSTAGHLAGLVTRDRAPFPRLDVPIMNRQWSVWLPGGYEVTDVSDGIAIDSIAPRTWSQRLFGALGRGAGTNIFNPLVAGDWRATLVGASDLQNARSACDELAANLGTLVAESINSEELTWGQLLSLCGETESRFRRALLVDSNSLAWLGLTPQSRVRYQSGISDRDRGRLLLEQENLVLLADRGVILLTTTSTAASFSQQLAESDDDLMRAVLPGPLAEELRAAAGRATRSHFEAVDVWRAAPALAQSPWSLAEAAGRNVTESRGWSAYTLQLSDGVEPEIRIVRRAAMSSLGWSIFLALVGIGLWRGKAYPAAMLMTISLAASAALLLPAAYLPLASAAFLASVACLAIGMVKVAPPPARSSDLSHGSAPRRSTASHPVAGMTILVATLSFAGTLHASQPETAHESAPPKDSVGSDRAIDASADLPPAAAPGPLPSVFVPVDGQQKLVGGKYLVPEKLYTQLSRESAAASGQPKDWLVARGSYEGTLSRDPVTKRLSLSQLKATFDVQVFQPNVHVRLPFAREGLLRSPVARLEGRATPLAWNAAGDELIIGPLAADRYRLEIDLQPSPQSDASTSGFDLAIPPLPNATLELAFPTDTPSVELPTARGEIRFQKVRGTLMAQLGACDRLAVRWPQGSGQEAAAPNLEVEELMWVKLRPGTTVVDTRFKYRVLAGRVSQIHLLTDPRLRLLPATTPQSLVTAVRTIPGDPQKIDLELARAVTDQVVVDLSFLVTGTSGVGNLRLPRLESSGARAARRWLGVSVDPALQSRVQAGEDSKQIEVPDFTAAWGSTDAKPMAAFGIPRGEPMWGLSTQPNEPHTAVEQTLAIGLSRNSSRVQFDAVLSISGGYLFQLVVQGPPELAIEQVSVIEDDSQRVARWSKDEAGHITVFFTAPLNGRQRLSLQGRWNAAAGDALAIPQFQVVAAETKRNQLQLYRQSAVLAEVDLPPGVSEIEPPEAESPEGFGAMLGCYLIDDASARISVRLKPNVPRMRVVTATYLQRDGQRWMADMDCHVEVTEGLVDSLEFEIPAQWSEPFRIEPAARFKILPIRGDLRRMIVYPEEPLGGKYQLKLRGRVALSAGDRLRVPDIVPLRAQQTQQFVVLPQHLDLQQITWDTVGLSRAPLPADFVAPLANVQSLAVYQVTGEHFQASLKAVERSGSTSHVALADIHVIWQSDGNCQGVAAFDLEPGTASACELELPSAYRLLHVSIESLPAQIVALEGHRWRLGLGPQQLPQRVEVVYAGPLEGTSRHRHFQAPRLVDLNVETTLWTIYGPPQFGSGRSADVPRATGAAEQQLARLKCLTALVQLPSEIIGEHLPEEIARWYQPWRKRCASARAALDWQLIASRQNRLQSEQAIEAQKIEAQIAAVDARLGAAGPAGRQTALTDAASDLIAVTRGNALPTHYMARGECFDLDLAFPAPFEGGARRVVVGLAILLAGATGAVVLRNRPLPTLAPWVVLGAAGLAWWLFLTPSFIGFAALLAACWPVLRKSWRGTQRLLAG